ncbi:MAG: dihydrolipoyl dehydrogenase [Candidatus Methanomethyliaceae archaeon]|nr:dihydrolipoyl dehydrogenase [Candidatus Methanomethyliaceae archaeon]
MKKFDVIVVGGGPGGYVSAIRLSQLGKKVALVEEKDVGGTCLNRGCIPTKALLHVGEIIKEVRQGERLGIRAEKISVDFQKVQQWIVQIVSRLRSGIEFLLKSYNVELIRGHASLKSDRSLFIFPQKETIEGDSIIIASGSTPSELPFARSDSRRILTSDDIFKFSSLPRDLIILGGGVVGVEMATAFSSLGTSVTIIEIMDQILPGYPKDLVSPVESSLRKMGVQIKVKMRVNLCEYTSGGDRVRIGAEDGTSFESDHILLSVGRKPNTQNLSLESAGVKTDEKGFIKVNNKMETNAGGVFAIGDVVGLPFLAHKAMEEGYYVSEIICGLRDHMPKIIIPSVVYTDPEIATVGLDEEFAVRSGFQPLIGRFPFVASGRSLTLGRTEGFVKIIADGKTRRIIGAQLVGHCASELIGELSLAISSSLTMDDLASVVHPHPTLSESIIEGIRSALDRAIHYKNKNNLKS